MTDRTLDKAARDIGILLAQIDFLQEVLEESLEAEDAALVGQIRADWIDAHTAEPSGADRIATASVVDLNYDDGLPVEAGAIPPAPDAVAPAREQMTGCDDCGKELPHDAAVWTTDGASYCPKCRPQIAAAPVMDQPAPDPVAEALEQMVLHFQHWEMDMATQKPRIVDFEHQPYAVQKAMRALGKEPRT